MAVVGIDLGTTNTVIAAVRDGRAAALKDKHGNALLPSVVSFTPKGTPKVGTAGKARRTIDPENTVFSIKRLIGRPYDSEPVQKAKTRFPFTLKGGPGKSTLVNCYGQDHSLPEISALVLAEAQAIAEARLGEPVADAVITVPANFNDLQRAATKVAGRTAGLEVLRIINEPTAAALAYGFGKTGRERIAVYDFGGGTFDVTLLDLRDNVFEVLSTAGDTFLGGDDLDRAILDRMADELLRKQKVDASFDNLVREQLRVAAERLKIELSTRSMTKVRVEELDFEFTMRRSEFETMAEPFVAQTLAVCQEALELADISKKDLDQVLLVGGSTRIPLVRRRISSFFGKMPQSRINPDEVVAIGAAIQASALETKQNKASVMPAPLPRHSAQARNPGGGSTQLGLAGLRKTLAGTGRISDLPQQQQSVSSVLSALQSARPPAGRSHHLPTSPPVAAPRVRTGMGARSSSDDQPKRTTTLSGLASPAQAPETPPTSTNLGLGSLAPPPSSNPKPLHHHGASAPKADVAPMFPQGGTKAPSESPSSGDGSVTFDLEELETAPPLDEFEGLEDETTQVVEPARADAEAAKLDSIADAEDSAVGQIRPMNPAEPVELGDSALFTLEEDDDQEHSADLPMPAAGLPARIAHAPTELSDSALFSLDPDEDEPGDLHDLPVRSTRPPALDATQLGAPGVGLPIARRQAHAGLPDLPPGLPSRHREHPGPGQDLTSQAHHAPDDDVRDLPLVGAGLPERPLPGLPERLDATAHPHLGTSTGTPLGFSAPFDRTRFGTPGAGTVLPAPSVNELDELSVSAPLPTDDEPEPQFDLQPGARRSSALDLQSPASDSPTRAAVALDAAQPGDHPSWDEHAQMATPHEPTAHAPQRAAPLLLDVTPLSLGVEVVGGYVDRLIERNSPVPCERTRTFATVQDNQQLVRVRVSQGEDGRFEANTVLGEVELVGLPAGPRGTVKVDVSFSLDESGLLQVSARDPATGNAAQARLMLTGVAP